MLLTLRPSLPKTTTVEKKSVLKSLSKHVLSFSCKPDMCGHSVLWWNLSSKVISEWDYFMWNNCMLVPERRNWKPKGRERNKWLQGLSCLAYDPGSSLWPSILQSWNGMKRVANALPTIMTNWWSLFHLCSKDFGTHMSITSHKTLWSFCGKITKVKFWCRCVTQNEEHMWLTITPLYSFCLGLFIYTHLIGAFTCICMK